MKRTKKDKRRLLIWSLMIIILISYLAVFSYDYWSKILKNYNEKSDLEQKYATLLENEELLNSEIKKLQDPEYVAKYAREKYMYSKTGEIIIRIPDDKTEEKLK